MVIVTCFCRKVVSLDIFMCGLCGVVRADLSFTVNLILHMHMYSSIAALHEVING